MNVKKDQLGINLPPDAKQLSAMRQALENGAAIASRGTDNYALWSHLVESGHMIKRHCPAAWGCYQFEVTALGRAILGEQS